MAKTPAREGSTPPPSHSHWAKPGAGSTTSGDFGALEIARVHHGVAGPRHPHPTRFCHAASTKREIIRHLTMAETSAQDDPQPNEQCWECRRRRLVCDGTQPVCAKCRAAGIVCPGFADKKPLTWLAPGQVMSRARRNGRKKAPRETRNNKTQQLQVKPATPATPRSDSTSDDPGGSPPHDLLIGKPVELRPEVCDVFDAIMYCTSVCLAPTPAVRGPPMRGQVSCLRQTTPTYTQISSKTSWARTATCTL